jgi:hypothetical protein
MKASNNFVQIQSKEEKKGSFSVGNTNIIIGKVISVGEEVKNINAKQDVIFDTNKSLQYAIDGINYYFVDYKTILAVK